jgi:RNA polymerase-binding transcription factor DksA
VDRGRLTTATDTARVALARQRATVEAQVRSLRAELDELMASAALVSTDDEHDPDGATSGFERARVTALLDAAQRHLDSLDRAEQRLTVGSYGSCVRCGADIGAERLAALPDVDTCISCAAKPRSRGAR